jgi:hypothetical protein
MIELLKPIFSWQGISIHGFEQEYSLVLLELWENVTIGLGSGGEYSDYRSGL